jgi:hypothetical protein
MPPLFEMSCAISLARRLSNESTRNPLNPGMESSIAESKVSKFLRFQSFTVLAIAALRVETLETLKP